MDVVLRAGEMSLHDPYVPHGSGANGSGEKRVGFVVRFVAPDARPLQGRPPAILARGRDKFGHFRIVEPPSGADVEGALSEMKTSAARHFEAMLANLKS